MDSRTDVSARDPLLAAFVAARTDDAARPLLTDVLRRAALPRIRAVIVGHAIAGDGVAEPGDLEPLALMRLTQQVWGQRHGDEPMVSAVGATAAAAHACAERLRQRWPRRARLQALIRYVFRHDPTLAMWPRPDGGCACGVASRRGEDRVLAWPSVAAARSRLPPRDASAAGDVVALVRLARAIAAALGAPARLEDVVTLAAEWLGVAEVPASAPPSVDGPSAPLDGARFLARAWAVIAALPIRQRVALTMNLAGPSTREVIQAMAGLGPAPPLEIAAVLETDSGGVDALLATLPADDRAIAARLGLTRRQATDLRRCARERLARRLGIARGARVGGHR